MPGSTREHPIRSTLGTRLADLRVQFGRQRRQRLIQRELAEQIGVSRETVAAWEADVQVPTDLNLRKLAAFFDTPEDFLQDGSVHGAEAVQGARRGNEGGSEPPESGFRFRKVGQRIEARRHQRGFERGELISQGVLAHRIGATASTVAAWERGRHLPTGSLLVSLLRELEMSPAELFTGAKPSTPSLIRSEPILEEHAGSIPPDDQTEPGPRFPWTRTLITFHHAELARLDRWRQDAETKPALQPRRSAVVGALVNGLVQSGVNLLDLECDMEELQKRVAHGLVLATQEKST